MLPSNLFSCPVCRRPVEASAASWACPAGHQFPVTDGIPRFLPPDEIAPAGRTSETFGFQWTTFDVSNRIEDEQIFAEKTGLPPDAFAGKLVLDAGCGGGRYARLAGEAGADVVALDLSAAVQHARQLTASLPNVTVVQGHLFHPPLASQSFDIVYSIGVLHHTPDTERAFRSIARLVKPGGHLAVWLYRRNTLIQEILNSGARAVTTHLPVGAVLALSRVGAVLGGIPVIKHLNKVLNFSSHERWRTRVCDTFDWYAPPYQFHHSVPELTRWFEEEGFVDLRILDPARARGAVYGSLYRSNLLIGSGVNVAGTRKPC